MWTTTPAGHEIHIRGDKNMSEVDRLAMCAVADAYAKEQERRRKAFEHVWAQGGKHANADKEDAFWWFDAGCDLEVQKEMNRRDKERRVLIATGDS